VCTLVVAWQVFDEAPIAVAANRDEAFGRPSDPPAVRGGDPEVVAPRDEEAGGTWIGYNEAGVLAAITNRWTDRDRKGERQVESARLLRSSLQPGPGETVGAWLDRAGEALGDHEYGVCAHGDGFGTRSSSLIAIGEGEATYRYADGPPCRTTYVPVEVQI